MKKRISKATRDRAGRWGVAARIEFDNGEGGMHASYDFPTHGMSAQAIAAKRAEIETYHGKRAAKFVEFRAALGLLADGWRITDCKPQRAGEPPDVRLYVVAKNAATGGRIEISQVMHVDELPTPDAIVAMVNERIAAESAEASEAESTAAAALGLTINP